MKKILHIISAVAALLLAGTVAEAQTISVRGAVKDATNGEVVTGAAVQVEGGTQYSLTDAVGEFSINVSKDGTLVVSCLGFKETAIPVSGRSFIEISLTPDAQLLDETIVVAFGTTTKEAFTGSASVMKSDELQKHAVTNVANALVGTVAGLQMRGSSGEPGAGSGSINIRGISSMYASTDPLVIVDGSPYTASLSNISQSDIESITVLKDAASAALYGARGASGVILITTKKGREGDAVVTLDAKVGVNSRAIPDYDIITDPAEYYEAYYAQLYNYRFYGLGKTAEEANGWANERLIQDLGYQVYTVPDGEALIGLNGKLNSNATLGYAQSTPGGETYWYQPDDWNDETYRKALRQEYNVSARGGNDRSSYFASVGYLNEDGVIHYSDFERITARVKADYKIKKWAKLGANVNFVHSDQNSNPNLSTEPSSGNIMYYASHIAPIYPIYVRTLDADGNPAIRTDANGNPQYDYGRPGLDYPNKRAFLQTGNPLGDNRYNKTTNGGNQFNGSFTADFDITSFLKANLTSTVIWGESMYSNYATKLYGPKVSVNGELQKQVTTSFRTNNVQTLTYYDSFGDHNIDVMIGHEYYNQESETLWATSQGLYSESVLELNAAAKVVDHGSSSSRYNVEGFFASAQYNYAGKYMGSLSFRRDASSNFNKDNRWGNFWSIGGAWIVSKEPFMDSVSWIDMLKVKASIGQQGNDGVGSYAYVDLYTISPSGTYTMSPTFTRIGNPDLTWETTTNFNAGTEFSLLRGRISGSVDVYSKISSGQLFWLSVPESIGTRGYWGNMGDIRNSGIELSLSGDIIRTHDLTWAVNLNIAHNKDEILSLPESKKIAGTNGFTESTKWLEEGGSLYAAFYPKFAGLNEQGEALYWVDEELNGATNIPGSNYSHTTTISSEASRYNCGSTLPWAFGGLSSSLRYKNLDVSVTFDYQFGGKVYDTRYASYMSPVENANGAGSNFHKDWVKSWNPNNASSVNPRWQYTDKYATASSDRFLTDASYLNFQSFAVGYTLPQGLLKGFSTVRVYVSGENLCFWAARQGFDPRDSFTGNEYTSTYSPIRTISGGVQLTF